MRLCLYSFTRGCVSRAWVGGACATGGRSFEMATPPARAMIVRETRVNAVVLVLSRVI